METIHWLLLTYKVPPDPAAQRIAIWRRLKGLGAVYLQNGVCVLPKTDDHVRRLKMIERDISQAGGEGVILETVALDKAQEDKVVARFKADRDDQYREFIGKCEAFQAEIAKEFAIEKFSYAELEEEDADLTKLQGWIEKIRKLDFYGGTLAEEAAESLRACEQALDGYAKRVFDAHVENADRSPPGNEDETPQ
ncbi:Chromate resistance protein ChrB [Jiella sp. M17.18]|uniref:Chromate resistance protein ChrB n=1 Tax=Jiella sp. M17.18 TaxID=3234247 RepID=UPI0034DF885C